MDSIHTPREGRRYFSVVFFFNQVLEIEHIIIINYLIHPWPSLLQNVTPWQPDLACLESFHDIRKQDINWADISDLLSFGPG